MSFELVKHLVRSLAYSKCALNVNCINIILIVLLFLLFFSFCGMWLVLYPQIEFTTSKVEPLVLVNP